MNQHTESQPALASIDGRRNAFYVRCKQVGYCRPYAACVNHAQQIEVGAAANSLAPCEHAIRMQTCPALSMRKEEVLEDRAIYFTQRKVSDTPPARSEPTPQFFPVSKQKLTDASSSLPTVAAGSYADAINNFNHAA